MLNAYTSATIAMCYSDEERLRLASPVVDRLKREFGGRVNYLLPSIHERGYAPSLQKIVDNSICDSVRIKYIPVRRGPFGPEEMPAEIASFFKGASDLIARYGLYHRAPTDGFISVRSRNGGFYISCTRTDKRLMPLLRVAHVHRYDADSNTLEYSGNFLPSSDGVEAATLYDRTPWIQAIVHTHASRMFTRNPLYRHKIAIPPSTYGQARLGEEIAEYLARTATRDFVILDDHGEFIFGAGDAPPKSLDQIHNLIVAAFRADAAIELKARNTLHASA